MADDRGRVRELARHRQPPLFGTEPDARVWALAGEAADPRSCRVLDIGAGTRRNSLALARRGHPVDAVEMTPIFAADIRAGAHREALDARAIRRDVFAGGDSLRSDYQLIACPIELRWLVYRKPPAVDRG